MNQTLLSTTSQVGARADHVPVVADGNSLWLRQEPGLVRAKGFSGTESFYPIYRWRDYYAASPLDLVRMKGELLLNLKLYRSMCQQRPCYWSGAETMDEEIFRVGGPVASTGAIRTEWDYVLAICDALRTDIASAEQQNPETTNIILCGGKDSLNLLLLPWKNPTLVASAPPNWTHVVRFVRRHKLPFEVFCIEDRNAEEGFDRECLEGFSRLDLSHCRWGTELRRLALARGPVLFWVGSLGDLYMTPKWRTVVHPPGIHWGRLTREAVDCARSLTPSMIRRRFDRRILEPAFRQTVWNRGAMWQGVVHSILRGVTRSLVLSAYHGPRVKAVLQSVSLADAVHRDVRPLVGERLFGGPVSYPRRNPGPAPTRVREGLSDPQRFLALLRREGVTIRLP